MASKQNAPPKKRKKSPSAPRQGQRKSPRFTTPEPQTQLLDLNDDCLIALFSKLPIEDLNSMALTCTRLRTVAQDTFKYTHKSKIVDLDKSIINNEKQLARMRDLSQIFRIFGSMMTRISITFQIGIIYDPKTYLANTKLLNLMIKYCVGSLETLRFQFCRHLVWKKITGEEALFRNLKEFELIEGDYTCDKFAQYVKQVTKLSINGGSFEKYLKNYYPNLKSFTLNLNWHGKKNRLLLEGFLQQHTDLTELHLFAVERMDYSIVANMTQLTSLTVDQFHAKIEECSLMALAQLENLTSLTLSTNSQTGQLLKNLASAESLRELSLTFGSWSQNESEMEGIAHCRNLRKLHLDRRWDLEDKHLIYLHGLHGLQELIVQEPDDVTADGLIGLINHLPQLKKLNWCYASRPVKLSEQTCLDIVNIYRRRNQQFIINFFEFERNKTKLQSKKSGFEQFVKYYHDRKRLGKVRAL